jgi:hypothetical protein
MNINNNASIRQISGTGRSTFETVQQVMRGCPDENKQQCPDEHK